MKWQDCAPYIGENSVLTYKERYKTCTPYFGVPNVFYAIKNKVKGFDTLTEYLNESARIEFTYEQGRPVIAFYPNISQKFKAKKYTYERAMAYNYVMQLLKLLTLNPDEKISEGNTPVVYVPLDTRDNYKKVKHLARYFAFENTAMLTRDKFKKIKRQKVR